MKQVAADFNCLDEQGRCWGIDQDGIAAGDRVVLVDAEGAFTFGRIEKNEVLNTFVARLSGPPLTKERSRRIQQAVLTDNRELIAQLFVEDMEQRIEWHRKRLASLYVNSSANENPNPDMIPLDTPVISAGEVDPDLWDS